MKKKLCRTFCLLKILNAILTEKVYKITFNGDDAFISKYGENIFAAHRIGQLCQTNFYVERSAFAGIAGVEKLNWA